MLDGWAGMGGLYLQSCFTAGLLWHSRTPAISAASLFVKRPFVAEAQRSWDCSSTVTRELSVEVPRLLLIEGTRAAQSSWPCSARGLLQAAWLCPGGPRGFRPAQCVCGVLHPR